MPEKPSFASDLKVTVDFLIPQSLETDKGGVLRHIESDFAAVITPGGCRRFCKRVVDQMRHDEKGQSLKF